MKIFLFFIYVIALPLGILSCTSTEVRQSSLSASPTRTPQADPCFNWEPFTIILMFRALAVSICEPASITKLAKLNSKAGQTMPYSENGYLEA